MIVNSSYETKSAPIIKYVIPVSLKLLREPKRDIRSANDRLLQSLNQHMGPSLMSYTGGLSKEVRARIASMDQLSLSSTSK